MALKLFTTLRNNWKKTTFAGVVLAYGTNYAIDQVECNKLMTVYCETALEYGEQPIRATAPLRRIIVILNPAADKRNAKKNFEKYCAPILHLSGALVDIRVTKGEGDARKIVEGLKERVDAIVIAGGDGTISEVVTGLLRGFNHDVSLARRIPIGVLPLGKNNHIAHSIYGSPTGDEGKVEKVQALAQASMSIVQQAKSSEMNALCVQLLHEDGTCEGNKFYALHSIDWGNMKHAQSRRDKYWYFGPLKPYLTYVLNGFSLEPITAEITYANPCSGCKRCFSGRTDVKMEPKKQWFQMFAPKNTSDVKTKNYALIENDQCGVLNQQVVSSMDMRISVLPPPNMIFMKGQDSYGYQDFVKLGWEFEKSNVIGATDQIHAQQLDIIPQGGVSNLEKSSSLYIDNEQFDLKPLRVILLENTIQVYNPV